MFEYNFSNVSSSKSTNINRLVTFEAVEFNRLIELGLIKEEKVKKTIEIE